MDFDSFVSNKLIFCLTVDALSFEEFISTSQSNCGGVISKKSFLCSGWVTGSSSKLLSLKDQSALAP